MNEDNTPNTSNMGLAIALGAGFGVIFGEFVFDNVGFGIAVGAALGIAFSIFSKSK
jgi:hypothetical protein